MSGARADGRSKGAARHVRLYHWMLESDAWRSLDPSCRAVYFEIARRYTGNNNGRIGCSIREMASGANIGKSTAQESVQLLVERGFLIREQRGHLGTGRTSSEWRITEHKCDRTGALPTKEFMRWRAPEI